MGNQSDLKAELQEFLTEYNHAIKLGEELDFTFFGEGVQYMRNDGSGLLTRSVSRELADFISTRVRFGNAMQRFGTN